MSLQKTTLTLLGVWLAGSAHAQEPQTIEQRLREFDRRLQTLEAEQTHPTATTGRGRRGVPSSAFNPAVSLILDGKYAGFAHNPETYALPGFALAEESGPGEEGLSLGESELVMSANIDDQFHGGFTAAVTPENAVEVEEAFIETLALGGGFTAKAGRFFSHIGYHNPVHAHAWDFADPALVYRAMLGNQFSDDGVQLRWVAPTDVFVELGAELFRGQAFPAGGAPHSGRGAKAAFVHIGGDVGASHAWRAGLSRLDADAENRASGDNAAPDLFTGNTKLTGIDFVWKWAPDGNPRMRNLKIQAEYFKRDESGTFDPASSGTPIAHNGEQHGWYAQFIYQFIARWRAGLRFDKLTSDSVDPALAGTVLDNGGHDPRRASIMLDFSNSEFSRLRLQVNRDESRLNEKDTQWYLQYVMSLGAHGAHTF